MLTLTMLLSYCSATQIQLQLKYLALSAAHVSDSWMSEMRATMVCNYQGKNTLACVQR